MFILIFMSKLVYLNSLNELNFEKLGFKAGLEIHQQLNCGKLFCTCPCEIVSNESLDKEITRKLRFSLSESGEIDKAAENEFKKGKYNIYKYNDKIACLVDLDEEPPNGPNKKALDTAVRVGQMLNINFFDKIQFMRKLIIDGSVTSGFQRTAMLGFNGKLKTKHGDVDINGINLEEDSCRAISREDGHTIFSLDRQGIPLIEITTGPQIYSPTQMIDTARQIGNILRSFPEVRRGLGTIRQDLNVSIAGGSRIEIKGAQNLKLIGDVVEAEAKRQIVHLSIIEELKNRGINNKNFSDFKVYDVSDIFRNCESNVVKSNAGGENLGVFAIKLFNFKDVIGHEVQENYRFATEISDRNKTHFPNIKGLFHSDELPKYGISDIEVKNVFDVLKLNDNDSFILIANKKDVAKKSLENIFEIISELLLGVPSEVRQVDSKGLVTKFLRPMPGGARMYPETDIRDIIVDDNYLNEMKSKLPELFSDKIDRLKDDLNLEENKILEVMDKFSEEQVKELIEISGKTAKFIYSVLFDIPKDIKKREGVEIFDFRYSLLCDILSEVKNEVVTQQTIRDLFVSLYKDKLKEVDNLKAYLDDKGLILEVVDDEVLENKIKEIVQNNKGAPFGALMGISMKEFGGKVEGKKISQILKKYI